MLEGIRNHWGIESYHYIKDITFREDASKIMTKEGPCNMSILRTIAINIYQKFDGYITDSIVRFANNTNKLAKLISE